MTFCKGLQVTLANDTTNPENEKYLIDSNSEVVFACEPSSCSFTITLNTRAAHHGPKLNELEEMYNFKLELVGEPDATPQIQKTDVVVTNSCYTAYIDIIYNQPEEDVLLVPIEPMEWAYRVGNAPNNKTFTPVIMYDEHGDKTSYIPTISNRYCGPWKYADCTSVSVDCRNFMLIEGDEDDNGESILNIQLESYRNADQGAYDYSIDFNLEAYPPDQDPPELGVNTTTLPLNVTIIPLGVSEIALDYQEYTIGDPKLVVKYSIEELLPLERSDDLENYKYKPYTCEAHKRGGDKVLPDEIINFYSNCTLEVYSDNNKWA